MVKVVKNQFTSFWYKRYFDHLLRLEMVDGKEWSQQDIAFRVQCKVHWIESEINVWLSPIICLKLGYVTSHQGFYFCDYYLHSFSTRQITNKVLDCVYYMGY